MEMFSVRLFQVGFLLIRLSTLTNGHVLFAANTDDFKTFARELVSEDLADRLVAFVSQAGQQPIVLKNPQQAAMVAPATERPVPKFAEPTNVKPIYVQPTNVKPIYVQPTNVKPIYVQPTNVRPTYVKPTDVKLTYVKPPNAKPTYVNPTADKTKKVEDGRQSQYEFEIEENPRAKLALRQGGQINFQGQKAIPVNLDQLVEKVRERLLDDFTKNPAIIEKLINSKTKSSPGVAVPKRNISERPDLELQQRDEEYDDDDEYYEDGDYEDDTQVTPKNVAPDNPGYLFHEVNLKTKPKQNDSYEEYIFPKKEEDIFSSDEEDKNKKVSPNYKAGRVVEQVSKTTNTVANVKKTKPTTVSVKVVTTPVEYEDDNETATEKDSFKARTENIYLDYKDSKSNSNPNLNLNKDTVIPKKSKLGTMIPTRETYKMTSPNYYGQLPTVAEKYDFNEPIPVKDQEEENLKQIGPAPAIINGNVKIGAT